jgi:hypothetical protein
LANGQLWRLLVIASVDPGLWAKKRANERKLVDVEARQLDGLFNAGRRGVEGGFDRWKRLTQKSLGYRSVASGGTFAVAVMSGGWIASGDGKRSWDRRYADWIE